MASGKKFPRGLKICCGVTALFLIILLVVLIVLSLTILKAKEPQIIAHSVSLDDINFEVFPVLKLNITLGLEITVKNRNYGSFKYKDTTANVRYRGAIVGEAPIKHDTLPARGEKDISISVEIIADKLLSDPNFLTDLNAGLLNFTSSTTLQGKASVFKILKLHAIAFSTCEISVFVEAQEVDSKCNSEVSYGN